MQSGGLVGFIKCGGGHYPFSHVKADPLSWNSFSTVWPPLVMCHWCGLTVRACGLLGTIMDSSAMDMTCGTGTLFKFLYPTTLLLKLSYHPMISKYENLWKEILKLYVFVYVFILWYWNIKVLLLLIFLI